MNEIGGSVMTLGSKLLTAHKGALAKAVEDADRTRLDVVKAGIVLIEALETDDWTRAKAAFDVAVRNHYNAMAVLPAEHRPVTWELPS